MIGHLQKNKVKYIAPFISMIHSVDSLILLNLIEKEAIKINRDISVLLQVKIASEESKFGLSENEIEDLLNTDDYKNLTKVKVCGLMGMATYTNDELQVRSEFRKLNSLFKRIQGRYFSGSDSFTELSMGMSHDYKIAIEEGATIVRIGSSIFGTREYQNK
jgi:pyridoxal phosphate enzyme (YggS family)